MKIIIVSIIFKKIRKVGNYLQYDILLFCCMLFFISSCKAQRNINELTNLLVKNERSDSVNLYSEFSKIGKNAIPYLIDVIDTNKQGFVGFQDYCSSTFYPVHLNFIGIRAAYMIEYVLSESSKIQIFPYGVIVKIVENKEEMKPLSYEDIKVIKELYKQWWERNKLKPINELKEDWKNNKRALTGTNYTWK